MSQYDVESPVARYGDAGAAAYRGFQMELMRRAAVKNAQDAKDRQDRLDAQAKLVQDETLATLKESRASEAAQREAATKKTNLDTAVSTLVPGTPLDAATSGILKKNGGAALVLGKPATPEMTMGVPSQFAAAPEGAAAQSEVPTTAAAPASEEFAGTPAQQKEVMQQRAIDHLLENLDPEDPLYKWALTEKTGKTPPAGIVVPKTGAETKAAHDLKMERVERDMKLGKPIEPDVKAEYEVWKQRNATDQEKANQAANAASAAASRVDARTAKTQLFQTKQQFRRELTENEKKLDADVERSDRALTLLNSPNFVTDAVAGPEFLQIVAGGMGSGLRMTDAELRRINDAQTKIDQLKGYLAKWVDLPGAQRVTIQNEMRDQMKSALEAVHAARTRKSKLASEALDGLGSVEDEASMDKTHAKYWDDRIAAGAMSNSGAPAAPAGKSGETPEERRARIRKAAGL